MHVFNGKPIIRDPNGGKTLVYPTVCLSSYQEQMYGHANGIFSGDLPFDYIFPVFMIQMILALLGTKLIYYVLGPWIRSKVVCNTLAGIILGPSVLGQSSTYMEKIFPDKQMYPINTMVNIALAYYIFITAVKMDAARSFKSASSTWIISMPCFILRVILIGYFGNSVQGYIEGIVKGTGTAIVDSVLSITFFTVIAEAMKEHNLLTTELGQLAMSSAMNIEMISWAYIIIIKVALQLNFMASIRVIVVIVLLSLFGSYIARPLILQIIKRTPEGNQVSEIYIIIILVSALIMSLIADLLYGSIFPGALVMGLIIPDGPPLGAAIVEKAELMVMEFFMPIFYFIVGYHVDVFSLLEKDMDKEIYLVLILVLVSHLATILGTLFGSLFYDIKLRNAILLSFILNFKGIIDLGNYDKWFGLKVMETRIFTTLVLSNLFLTIIYNILLDIFYKPQTELTESLPRQKLPNSLQLTPLSKELRVLICVHSEDNVHTIINLVEASNPSAINPICAYVIHAIELVGRAAPLFTSYENKKKTQPNSSTDHIVRAFTNYSTNSRGPVTIRPFTMLAPYRTMHNIVCHLAMDKEIPLIIAPFQGNREANCSRQSSLVREFNIHLQENAPCTVGILLDKGLNQRNSEHFSCNIAIIFIGGVDDREALSLAIRMSRNPYVSITFLRIIVKRDEQGINEIENQLDDALVQEFKDKNSDNACVVCLEAVANSSLQLLALIRSFTNNYDLVIVGKMPIRARFVEEMIRWVEYPELGLLGDVLASSDISNDNMSVLVMQHFSEMDESSPRISMSSLLSAKTNYK